MQCFGEKKLMSWEDRDGGRRAARRAGWVEAMKKKGSKRVGKGANMHVSSLSSIEIVLNYNVQNRHE